AHFFFSSRRRHTRFSRDWSSDVCSSDLLDAPHQCRAVDATARRWCLFSWIQRRIFMSSDRLTEIATKVLSTTPTRRDLLKATACVLLTAPVATWSSRRALAADLDAVIGPWGDPATLVTAIGAGTLAAASVAETVESYLKVFGYVAYYRRHVPYMNSGFLCV